MTLTVPAAPPLAHHRAVELMKTGQWDAMSGRHTFTREDLAAAVAALECPAVRRPVLKFGHDGAHGVGEPALGWVDNMGLTDDGATLIGDYVGMPGWFGDVLGSAYPDRSIEGTYDLRCQLGHTHPFVVEAVALLGVDAPAIGTLASLAGVAATYGVELAQNTQGGEHVVLTIRNEEASTMPNPNPATVAAGVTTEDVRRAYYDDASWELWITEFHLDPLQLIVVNDYTGEILRVPVIASGDGVDGVTFGDAVPVVVRYEDVPATTAVAAGAPPRRAVLSYASRAESRPGATQTPATAPAAGSIAAAAAEGSTAVEFTPEQITTITEALGIAADSDAQTIAAAAVQVVEEQPSAADAQAAAVAAAAGSRELPEGIVAIDSVQLEQLRASAAQGVAAREQQEQDQRRALVDAAVSDGRIAPARREAWLSSLKANPASAQDLAGLATGLIPVTGEIGHAGDGDEVAASADTVRSSTAYKNWSL